MTLCILSGGVGGAIPFTQQGLEDDAFERTGRQNGYAGISGKMELHHYRF